MADLCGLRNFSKSILPVIFDTEVSLKVIIVVVLSSCERGGVRFGFYAKKHAYGAEINTLSINL